MPRAKKRESGFRERASAYDPEVPYRVDLRLGPGGRIVIPAAYRKAMQVKEGDRLMAHVVDGELRVITPAMGIKLAQKLVRETIRGNESLVDSLFEERRREVADEYGED
jgi:AbrB family looped-hinge helix DNA binding protein